MKSEGVLITINQIRKHEYFREKKKCKANMMGSRCSYNLFFFFSYNFKISLRSNIYKVSFWQITGAVICKLMYQISSFGNTVLWKTTEFALCSVCASLKMSHIRSEIFFSFFLCCFDTCCGCDKKNLWQLDTKLHRNSETLQCDSERSRLRQYLPFPLQTWSAYL